MVFLFCDDSCTIPYVLRSVLCFASVPLGFEMFRNSFWNLLALLDTTFSQGHRYFRIVDMTPSAFKAMPLAGLLSRRLSDKMVAVAELRVQPLVDSLLALHWQSEHSGTIQLLGGFSSDHI
eukprot:1676857-Amphidinium_carterae.1